MYIFYYAGGKFGEVDEVFLTKKHSPDARCGGTGRVRCAVGIWPKQVERTGRSALDAGGLLCARPVLARVSALDCKGF